MSATNRGIAKNVARDAKEGERGGEGVIGTSAQRRIHERVEDDATRRVLQRITYDEDVPDNKQ